MPDFDAGSGHQPACGAISNNCGKVIFLRKLRQHFSGSRGVFVHENHDAALKSALAEAFGYERDGSLFREFEGQGQKFELESGNVSESR